MSAPLAELDVYLLGLRRGRPARDGELETAVHREATAAGYVVALVVAGAEDMVPQVELTMAGAARVEILSRRVTPR